MKLHTPLTVEDCKARLFSAVDPVKIAFRGSGYAGSKPILGKLQGNSFRLQKRRYYRNSFAPFFFGHFVPSGSGTSVEGEFRMHPFVKAFMIVWFSFLGLFIAAVLVSCVTDGGNVHGSAAFAIPLFMAVFAVALVKFGQWLGRGEEREIVAFLKTTFEAHGDS